MPGVATCAEAGLTRWLARCRLARLEHLMERRPELLSSVMLRQNPHNVHEWHKRVKLFAGQPHKQILTFTEAVTTVDIDKVPAARLRAAMRMLPSSQLLPLNGHMRLFCEHVAVTP